MTWNNICTAGGTWGYFDTASLLKDTRRCRRKLQKPEFDCIVITGATAAKMADQFPTEPGRQYSTMYGIELFICRDVAACQVKAAELKAGGRRPGVFAMEGEATHMTRDQAWDAYFTDRRVDALAKAADVILRSFENQKALENQGNADEPDVVVAPMVAPDA